MRTLRRLLGAAGACLLAAYACLPKDVRPMPGSVYLTLSGDDALTHGFTTDDGWSIAYSRFLISLGHTSVSGPDKSTCVNSYGDSNYARVSRLDDRTTPQKVSITYALGHCDIGYRISNPGNNPVRSEGVTPADVDFMRTGGRDAWVDYDTGVTLYAEGTATKAGVTKHFAWKFRQSVRYNACGVEENGEFVHGFKLDASSAYEWAVSVHGKALFWDHTDGSLAKSRFEPFAKADDAGNADGEVTLEELATVPIDGIGTIDPPPSTGDAGVGDTGAGDDAEAADAGDTRDAGDGGLESTDAAHYCSKKAISTLGDYVYLRLVPVIAQFRDATGRCNVDESCTKGRQRGF